MKHVTIKDVARKLNCSVSTVSRAFNDKYDIRKETRELILSTAKEMCYFPNPIARSLLKQCSNQVGVVVPEFINPFFPEVIMGIQEFLFEKGFQVLIMQSNESNVIELQNIKKLEDNFVDGIILSLSQETQNIDYLQQLIRKGFPLVIFNRINESLPVSQVVFDDYKWSFFAVEHLIKQGIETLIHLSGPKHLLLSRNRSNGFMDALRKHKIKVSNDDIIETGFLISDGEREVEKLIAQGRVPGGFFCVNDPTAYGAILALKRHGFKIPEDVAVMGFTETPTASLIDPPLSSVVQPTHEMGITAARLLLKQIESKSYNIPETVVLNGRLNIRESTVKKLIRNR